MVLFFSGMQAFSRCRGERRVAGFFRCVAIGQPDGGVVFELVGVADVLDVVRAFHHIADGEDRQKSAWAFAFTKTV